MLCLCCKLSPTSGVTSVVEKYSHLNVNKLSCGACLLIFFADNKSGTFYIVHKTVVKNNIF